MSSVSHGGQGNGIMTHFQAVPETGDAIVILTNTKEAGRSSPMYSATGLSGGHSDRRHGKDHLGALWALCGHRYADLCKFNGVIEADCRLPSAKTDFVQSASPGRRLFCSEFGFVVSRIFVCCFSFSGSVGMAWGLGACPPSRCCCLRFCLRVRIRNGERQ